MVCITTVLACTQILVDSAFGLVLFAAAPTNIGRSLFLYYSLACLSYIGLNLSHLYVVRIYDLDWNITNDSLKLMMDAKDSSRAGYNVAHEWPNHGD